MKALLLVDLQNDFLPSGALPVPEGDQVIPVANRLLPYFTLVVATQDWHPADHGSFAVNHPGRHPGEVIELEGCRRCSGRYIACSIPRVLLSRPRSTLRASPM